MEKVPDSRRGSQGQQPQQGQQQGQQQAGTLPNRSFSTGDSDPFIQQVQRQLNTTTCIVAASGVGSAGQETEYFGSLTEAAVKCYQRQYMGLTGSDITGVLDPATAAHLFGASSAGSSSGSVASSGSGTTGSSGSQQQQQQEITEHAPISETYTVGDSNAIIQRAKQILNTTQCKVGIAGQPDSAGSETTTLTQFTANALRCYQRLNNLAANGNLTPETWDALTKEPGAAAILAQQQQEQQQRIQRQQQQQQRQIQQQQQAEEQTQTNSSARCAKNSTTYEHDLRYYCKKRKKSSSSRRNTDSRPNRDNSKPIPPSHKPTPSATPTQPSNAQNKSSTPPPAR